MTESAANPTETERPVDENSPEQRPVTHDEAVEIIREDPALNAATDKNDEDS